MSQGDSDPCEQPDPARRPAQSPPEAERADSEFPGNRMLFYLSFLALIAGLAAGLIGGAFRWLLTRTEGLRTELSRWALDHGPFGWLATVAVSAAAAALATWISVRWPKSAGSGIQQVEAVELSQDEPTRASTLPARFVGGQLSMGAAGLVLGREGPMVHMGAAIGAAVGRLGRATHDELRVLQTCLSGAGLAVAFNAPIGGAMFVAEEVAHKIRFRYVVWTMVSVAAAIIAARTILPNQPDFQVRELSEPPLASLPVFLVFGVFLGFLAVGYHFLITRLLAGLPRIPGIPAVGKGALVGAVIGLGVVYVPDVVGGGDTMAQSLLDGRELAFWTVTLYLILRFCSGPLSYAVGASGGLFAPMLALGTLCGVFFAELTELAGIALDGDTRLALMLAGMAALFAAVVRAPFTGIVLVMEMCAVTTVTLPMIAASLSAVLVASSMRTVPVYDALREMMLARDAARAARHTRRTDGEGR